MPSILRTLAWSECHQLPMWPRQGALLQTKADVDADDDDDDDDDDNDNDHDYEAAAAHAGPILSKSQHMERSELGARNSDSRPQHQRIIPVPVPVTAVPQWASLLWLPCL